MYLKEPVKCNKCGDLKFSDQPCVFCYGSKKAAQQQCASCFSFNSGYCNSICAEVLGWWTGCILHIPKNTKID